MSDQHSPLMSEYCGGLAKTPNLCEMAKNGVSFDAAYTPCPLCVPARMAFLSGRLPSKTGILNNYSVLPNTLPTIAHAFDAAGYETTLIGRMHFVGEDQHHGFQHRLVGDITSPEWKPTKAIAQQIRGPFMGCFAEPGCTKIIGGGGSPVQQYDEEVVKTAIDWLSQPHDKPQFIIVGTYAPHFPYVAPLDKYRYYLDKIQLPWGFEKNPDYLDPAYRIRIERSSHDPEVALKAKAAYLALIENLDEQIGRVREAFKTFCGKTGGKGAFIYTSDHGDQCGERGLFAKMSFFESAARIPLLMEGDGLPAGVLRKDPVSLLDLFPTVCDYAGIECAPCIDGVSALEEDKNRTTISEMYGIFGAPGKFPEVEHLNSVSRMVRKGNYKFITRAGFEDWDMLFDLENDPEEHVNIITTHTELAREFRQLLSPLPSNEAVKARMQENWKVYDFMQAAQIPSEELISNYWNKTSEENLQLPLDK